MKILKKCFISFIAVVTVVCFGSISVFADIVRYPISHYVTKSREINVYVPDCNNFAYLSEYLRNPSDYYVLSSSPAYSNLAENRDYPAFSDYALENRTVETCFYIFKKSILDLAKRTTNGYQLNTCYYVSHSYISAKKEYLAIVVTISPDSNDFTATRSIYYDNSTIFPTVDTLFSLSGANHSDYDSISTDKIKIIFNPHEYVMPDPPTPPPPPDPPKPPNPEFTPWYPSDGLTFLERHIRLTTGNVVTVGIWIFAIILAVLIAIRVVKIFSNPS